jgi:hypothetical protein
MDVVEKYADGFLTLSCPERLQHPGHAAERTAEEAVVAALPSHVRSDR